MGPLVAEFEEELARACEVEHAVAVSSGTAALHLAVLALGLAARRRGARARLHVPGDGERRRARGPAAGARRRRPGDDEHRPRAASRSGRARRRSCAVHLFGRPAPDRGAARPAADRGRRRRARRAAARPRLRVARADRLPQLPSAQDRHDRRGRRGHDDDERVADAVRRMRNHGWRSLADADMPEPGLNYRLSDMLCAVGLPQLRRLDELLAARTRVAAGYSRAARASCRSACPAWTRATSTAGRPT